MSYSTKRFKPKTSKTLVRSSHSSVRPEVNVLKCPSVPLESVVLEEIEAKMPRTVTYKPRRSFGTKKNPKKVSPPKTKSKSSTRCSRSTVIGARSGPGEPMPTDGFLEEMRAGLDEMGEKLRNVEKELTRQKIIGKPPLKPPAPSNKNVGKKNEGSVVYNPIDFTEMDFDAAGGLEVENSFEDEVSGESKKNPSNPEIRPQFPSNEAVESVIAKIRSDIKNWRISKGMEDNSNGDAVQEPSVTSNRRGEILVREEAERETPYESNRVSHHDRPPGVPVPPLCQISRQSLATWVTSPGCATPVMRTTDPVFNVTFVGIIEQHPCLYACDSADYNNRAAQEKAWESVASEVKESVTDCKERWKNIRGCYTRYLKSLNVPGNGGKKQPYYLAEPLNFLLHYTKSRKAIDYFSGLEPPMSSFEPSVKLEENGDDDVSTCPSPGGFTYERESSPDVRTETEFPPQALKRIKLTRDASEPSFRGDETDSSHSKTLRDEKKSEESDLAFLTSLLSDMKEMEPNQKRRFKIGILELAGRILNEPSCPGLASASGGSSSPAIYVKTSE